LALLDQAFEAHITLTMSRKPKKGYYVRGEFVAEGSELDLELKAELKGTDELSKTELKAQSTELQKLGTALLDLRADLFDKLPLSEKLRDTLADAKRITNFEGKRRQMQFVGKLMRLLDEDALAQVREALEVQHSGSARETLALHQAEQWRDKLIADDDAFGQWVEQFPATDAQRLRALVRQARKDAPPADRDAMSKGLAPRQGRAFRDIFQLVRDHLAGGNDIPDRDDDREGDRPIGHSDIAP
jgi:ribosome-associated protein